VADRKSMTTEEAVCYLLEARGSTSYASRRLGR
jgi:hypothetical protein